MFQSYAGVLCYHYSKLARDDKGLVQRKLSGNGNYVGRLQVITAVSKVTIDDHNELFSLCPRSAYSNSGIRLHEIHDPIMPYDLIQCQSTDRRVHQNLQNETAVT